MTPHSKSYFLKLLKLNIPKLPNITYPIQPSKLVITMNIEASTTNDGSGVAREDNHLQQHPTTLVTLPKTFYILVISLLGVEVILCFKSQTP